MKPTIINLAIPVKNLEGKTSGEISLGSLLSNLIVGPMPGFQQHSIKIYEWALALHADKTLSLDTEDLTLFKRIVESADNLTVLGRAQILLQIKLCEDMAKSENVEPSKD